MLSYDSESLKKQAKEEYEAAVQIEYDKFITGDELKAHIEKNAGFNKRDAFYKLSEWLQDLRPDGHIGALFGLRRTGKTVVLHQLAYEYMSKGVKVAYAVYGYKQTEFNVVYKAIKRLVKEGYQIVLLDEITRTEGFYDSSMLLSDDVCAKVVIAGTESLMLWWAMGDPLFGRTILAKTTTMRYQEYKRLFRDATLIDFMCYGGVLWDNERGNDVEVTIEKYLETSVIENIKNSVNLLEDWHTHSDKGTLMRVSADTLFRLLVAVCECAAQVDVEAHVKANWGDSIAWRLTQAHTNKAVGGMKSDSRLKVIRDGIQTFYMCVPSGEYDEALVEILIKRLKNLGFMSEVMELHDGGKTQKTLVITQPYIKREFVRRNLSMFAEFKNLELESTSDKMESIAYGVILEDIVYLEARTRYFDNNAMIDNVAKFRGKDEQEIDVCIFHKDKHLSLIEVKLNEEKYKQGVNSNNGHDRWLTDEGVAAELKRVYGAKKITRTVLYMGVTDEAPDNDGVRWVNVEEWLLGDVEI